MIIANDDPAYGAQSVAYTGTAGTITGFKSGIVSVLVWTTSDAYVKVGEGVTATTASTPIPAYTPIILGVPKIGAGAGAGDLVKVSAIQISAGGTLYVKPVA
jgi:hypothetical protein